MDNTFISNRFDSTAGRPIPFSLQLKVIFGNVICIFGLFFTAMALVFMFLFGKNVDITSLKFSEKSPFVEGTVEKIESTNARINNQTVYAYRYIYPLPDGKNNNGVSYTEGMVMDEGQKVTIQFLERRPEISRIKGMQNDIFEWWVLLIILPFLLVGVGFSAWSIRKGINAIFLLKYGLISQGKLINKTPTNLRINNRLVYAMQFEFEAHDKRKYIAEAKTHLSEHLEDEAFEKLVYDSRNPEKAVLIDSLPKAVKIFFYHIEH